MPVWTAVLVGALLLAAGGLVPYVVVRAAAGRLRRNRWVGVRTPGTLASDAGWRAAGAVLALAGLGALVVGAGSGAPGVFAAVVVGGAVLGAAVLVAGAVRADAAGRGALSG